MLIQRVDTELGYRFYQVEFEGQTLRLPSVTSVLQVYPKGIGYEVWLGKNGFEKAMELRDEAGEVGSRVHDALARLFAGESVYLGKPGEMIVVEGDVRDYVAPPIIDYTPDEIAMIYGAYRWYESCKPEVASAEMTIFNPVDGWAGTLDLLTIEKEHEFWITDFKSAKEVRENHKIQVATYAHATHCIYNGKVEKLPKISGARVIRLDKLVNGLFSKEGFKLWPGPRTRKEQDLAGDYETFKHLLPIYKRAHPNWDQDDKVLEVPDSLVIKELVKETV